MSTIDMDSILKKAAACMGKASYKKKINDILDDIVIGGRVTVAMQGGGGKGFASNWHLAADKFIEVLQDCVKDMRADYISKVPAEGFLGETAVDALTDLTHGQFRPLGNGLYEVDIWFNGDLHRESLAPDKYDGIDNIAALLNSGYSARRVVGGAWHNKRIASLKDREGAHFIEQAKEEFINKYAKSYGVVDIQIDPIYE